MIDDNNNDTVNMKIEVGEMVAEIVGENYAGPPGTVAVLEYDDFPEGLMVFLKNAKIVAIRMRDDEKISPARGEYDGIMIRASEGPEATMGKEWLENSLAKAKKKFQ